MSMSGGWLANLNKLNPFAAPDEKEAARLKEEAVKKEAAAAELARKQREELIAAQQKELADIQASLKGLDTFVSSQIRRKDAVTESVEIRATLKDRALAEMRLKADAKEAAVVADPIGAAIEKRYAETMKAMAELNKPAAAKLAKKEAEYQALLKLEAALGVGTAAKMDIKFDRVDRKADVASKIPSPAVQHAKQHIGDTATRWKKVVVKSADEKGKPKTVWTDTTLPVANTPVAVAKAPTTATELLQASAKQVASLQNALQTLLDTKLDQKAALKPAVAVADVKHDAAAKKKQAEAERQQLLIMRERELAIKESVFLKAKQLIASLTDTVTRMTALTPIPDAEIKAVRAAMRQAIDQLTRFREVTSGKQAGATLDQFAANQLALAEQTRLAKAQKVATAKAARDAQAKERNADVANYGRAIKLAVFGKSIEKAGAAAAASVSVGVQADLPRANRK